MGEEKEILKYDIIIIGLVRNSNALSSAALAWSKEWSKTNRVFFIDRPFTIKDLFKEGRMPHLKDKLLSILFRYNVFRTKKFKDSSYTYFIPGPSLPINFLPKGFLYRILLKYNNHLVYSAINSIVKKYKIENYIFFNSFFPVLNPNIRPFVKVKPIATVYQSLDDITQEKYIAKHGSSFEQIAIKSCDIPIVTSKGLSIKYQDICNRKINVIENGVDHDLFNSAKIKNFDLPKNLVNIPKPYIIFTGHFSALRINAKLIKKIALRFNAYSIVIVGTYKTDELKEMDLVNISNLYFAGNVPIEDLPAILSHSEVAIIPYKLNSLTSNIYPLKVNEYLAAGIPCVSTNFSLDISTFNPYLRVANSDDEFLNYLKEALQEDFKILLKKRVEIAKENSWRNRIDRFEVLLQEFIKSKTT